MEKELPHVGIQKPCVIEYLLSTRQLAAKFKLKYKTIPMKTTLHYEKNEIIISDNFSWWTDSNIR